ncbi:Integrase recombinase xerD-like [Paramuricea clavata]|nr:Integrase recombinase xerD-like [Paramuricea clavata]
MEELRFWLDNLRYLNGYNIRPKVSLEPLTIHTDASGVGYGGYFTSLRDVNIHGHWSVEQSGKSSTFRELSAILLVLKTSVQRLQHKKVKIFSDSQSACRIVQVGSRIFELQNIAVDIFNICFINDIMIETQWIPRAENRTADVLSKTIDLDDWKLHPELFVMLHRAWGPFTIDRFAANYNTQLQRFNSRFWCPETEAVDAFTKNWSNEANWVCSPVALIIPVIRHMSVCKAKGTFIVPRWPSAIFWPAIKTKPGKFAPFVKDSLVLLKKKNSTDVHSW